MGDALKAQTALEEMLTKYVFLRNANTHALAANDYHAFLYALLSSAAAGWHIANLDAGSDAGEVYPTLVFTSVDETVGVTVALRLCASEAAPEAKASEQNHNTNLLTDFGCVRAFAVSLAF